MRYTNLRFPYLLI